MDELGKILGNILSSAPGAENGEIKAGDPPPAPPQRESAPSAPAGKSPDIFGLLNTLSPSMARSSPRMALLSALKPYLRPARRDTLEHAQSLISTAYSVRAALGALESAREVRDV